MNTDFEIAFARTIGLVRELSENATLRPAPNVLRCIPVKTFAYTLVPALRQRIDRKILIATLLAEMASPVTRQPSPAA